MEIGSSIHLDEISIVEYFIEGITDSRTNTSILYQSRNISELKENIIAYEKIGAPAKSLNFKGSKEVVLDVKTEYTIKCFKCGEKAHISKNCRSVDIKCKRFGHKSFKCSTMKQVEKPKNEKIKEEKKVHTLTEDVPAASRRIFKDIEVLNRSSFALVDTGSDISLLRYDTLLLLSDAALEPGSRILAGIGGKTITTGLP